MPTKQKEHSRNDSTWIPKRKADWSEWSQTVLVEFTYLESGKLKYN